MCVSVYVCVCVYQCGFTDNFGCLLEYHLLPLKQDLSLTWSSTISLGWPTSPDAHLSSALELETTAASSIFTCVPGTELCLQRLHDKHFTD